jgi:hypothetical protein
MTSEDETELVVSSRAEAVQAVSHFIDLAAKKIELIRQDDGGYLLKVAHADHESSTGIEPPESWPKPGKPRP